MFRLPFHHIEESAPAAGESKINRLLASGQEQVETGADAFLCQRLLLTSAEPRGSSGRDQLTTIMHGRQLLDRA